MNDSCSAEEPTSCFVPITDLNGFQSALEVPVELNQVSKDALKNRLDSRIWEQLQKFYLVVGPNHWRLTPRVLRRFPTKGPT